MTLALWLISTALAHLPNVATYTLTEGTNTWELDVAMSTDGMHHTLQLQHPGEDLSTVEAYGAKLVEAVLAFDNRRATLLHPLVALAPHETHVRFQVASPTAAPRDLEAKIDALEGPGQHNVLKVVRRDRRERVVHSASNAYRAQITLVQGKTP